MSANHEPPGEGRERVRITTHSGLTEEHLIALGRITVNYSFLEFLMRNFLIGLCGADTKTALILISGLGFDQLSAKLDSVYKGKVGENTKEAREFDEVKNRVREAAKKRNNVIHAVWEVGTTPGVMTPRRIERRARKVMPEKGQPLSSMDLDAINGEILDAATALAEFYIRVIDSLALWRQPREM